jgi:catalase
VTTEHPVRPTLTTEAGAPLADNQNTETAGPGGPLLIQDQQLFEKLAHFNRERIPERIVHARGAGAYGTFTLTRDVSRWTRAKFLSEAGKQTETFLRFSTVAGNLGSADAVRDPRGFALKFYTEEGNYDLVGNNTPVFFIRDPSNFSDFIHSQKRRADTDRRDNNMQWDFWTLKPESAHQVTILMSDRGTPKTLRHMNGYGSHTFMWINTGGEKFWIKYHFKTDQGVENFTDAEAGAMAAEDPDFHRKDLWDSIKAGDGPTWTLKVQIMPFEDAANYRFNPFDLTKVWPQADYPLVEVGRMVLDRNPENYFAEVEQAAFEPANMVPGIGPSPDKMLLGRLFSYPDTHRYRIGPNYLQLPVNAPQCPFHSYNKDGAMRSKPGSDPVYAPNSYGGPAADEERYGEEATWAVSGEMVRTAYELHAEDDDFGQAGTLVREVMSQTDRDNLVSNILGHAGDPDVTAQMKPRVVEYWSNVDADIGAAVAHGLGVPVPAGIGSR